MEKFICEELGKERKSLNTKSKDTERIRETTEIKLEFLGAGNVSSSEQEESSEGSETIVALSRAKRS